MMLQNCSSHHSNSPSTFCLLTCTKPSLNTAVSIILSSCEDISCIIFIERETKHNCVIHYPAKPYLRIRCACRPKNVAEFLSHFVQPHFGPKLSSICSSAAKAPRFPLYSPDLSFVPFQYLQLPPLPLLFPPSPPSPSPSPPPPVFFELVSSLA
mmetsp:Transcript_20632/g.49581  ORF Transcript_20632/g.49581 Transcript_20632/m.49581 type:complete len:154 (+) Transcript_20632:315-776(+)